LFLAQILQGVIEKLLASGMRLTPRLFTPSFAIPVIHPKRSFEVAVSVSEYRKVNPVHGTNRRNRLGCSLALMRKKKNTNFA
jgi:hypothetical protein